MGFILLWWLIITLFGAIALPVSIKAFQFLPDRGYGFSKPLGLLIIGFLAWIVGFVQFSIFSILFLLVLFAGFSYWLWVKYQDEIKAVLLERQGYILVMELFFAALFLLFLFFRMYNPDIIGTEKFMDLSFMNSMTRAVSFPPYDPWLAGEHFSISYYYFGYLLMSIMTKLSGVPPAIGFNLALALLFALAGTSVAALLYNLTKRLSVSLGGWAAIFLLGNLDGFRQVLLSKTMQNFNWWTPSRVIPDTINEFPFFSFLLGDMHPHMLSIPFIMLTLGLVLNHLKSTARDLPWKQSAHLAQTCVWGFAIGALGFLNSWDLPTLYFLSILAIFYQQYRQRPRLADLPWQDMLATAGMLLAMALVPYLPFYLNFHSQAKGIAFTTQNTQVGDFLLIYGLFVFMALTFLLARYHGWLVAVLSPGAEKKEARAGGAYCPQCGAAVREGKKICGKCGFRLPSAAEREEAGNPLARPLDEVPGWVKEFFFFLLQPAAVWQQGKGRLAAGVAGGAGMVIAAIVGWKWLAFGSAQNPLPYLTGLALIIIFALAILLAAKADKPETTFALMLLLTAAGLVFGCEVLHIKDTFTPPLDRMNTVFKFYYQVWFLLGVGAVYGVYWTFTYSLKNANLRLAWLIPVILLVAASLVYPYASVLVKTNQFCNLPTLDGSAYLQNSYLADREGIEWLRKNVKGQPVVLEATGAEYTDFARVSTFTGLPTVLGWAGHELQWRGNYDEPGKRIPEIDTLYSSQDLEATKALLDKYNVMFVFVGTLERQKYSAPALGKFGLFMEKVYEYPGGGVIIYRRR